MTTIVEQGSLETLNSNAVDEVLDSIESKLVIDETNDTKYVDGETTSTTINNTTTVITDKNENNNGVNAENNGTGLDAKQKKKYDKLAESILKRNQNTTSTAQTGNTVEDKYYGMIKAFLDLQEQNKKLQLSNKETEKSINNYIKQRDLMQAESNKSLLAKNKLESLCRELQKHNKLIKEENLQRISKEEEKRKEITLKFQSAIDEINQQVGSNSEKNNALIQENVQLTTKLKSLLEQYELREQHVEKVLKHKDLEIQLANAKLQQSELKLTECTERSKSEKAIYENHCVELAKKCEFHQESEKQLKSQLSMYTQKYEEFQTTLKKSNQVFESFRTEMDKMTKKIKKLEQETASWKSKWEGCDKSLQNVLKQREELEEKYKKSNIRADTMEKLSRTLQTERNSLKEQLKQFVTEKSAPTNEPEEDVSKKIEETTEKPVEVAEVEAETKVDVKEDQPKPINAEELVQEVVQKQLVSESSITNVVTAHIDETALSN